MVNENKRQHIRTYRLRCYFPCANHETIHDEEIIIQLIRKHTICKLSVSLTPRQLQVRWKIHRYYRVGWCPKPVWAFWKRENFLALLANRPVRCLFTVLAQDLVQWRWSVTRNRNVKTKHNCKVASFREDYWTKEKAKQCHEIWITATKILRMQMQQHRPRCGYTKAATKTKADEQTMKPWEHVT